MGKNKKTIAGEIANRLRRFTETLEHIEDIADLPKVLTVRTVKLDLRPPTFDAVEIKEIRTQLRVSQPVFAEFLGVSASCVKDWEQGKNVPQGPACRIMDEMQRDITLWRNRILELASLAE